VKKLETALDPVLAFWIALRDKDADLMGAAIDAERWMDNHFDRDPDLKDTPRGGPRRGQEACPQGQQARRQSG
jgi:hypothetical protein